MKTTTKKLIVAIFLPLLSVCISLLVFAQTPRGGGVVQQGDGGGETQGLPGDVCSPCTTKADCSAQNYCFPAALHCSSDQKACAPGAKLGDACQGGGTCLGVCGPLGDSPPTCGAPTACTYCDNTPQGQCNFPESCHTEGGMKYCDITNLPCDQLALGASCAPTIAGAHPQDTCMGTCWNGSIPAPLCGNECIAGLLCKTASECGGGTCTQGVCSCPTVCDPRTDDCGCGDGILDLDGPDDTVGTKDDEECESTFALGKISKVEYSTGVPLKLQIFTVSDNGYITIGGTNNCLGCQIYGVCGDGFVDGTGSYGPKEVCDNGEILSGANGALSGDGCSTGCNREIPRCSLGVSGSVYSGKAVTFVYTIDHPERQKATLFPLGDPNAIQPILFPTAPYKPGSIVYAPGYSIPPYVGKAVMVIVNTGNTSVTGMCMVNFTIDYCGDGVVQAPYEQCDDANTTNDDGCRNDCTADLSCTLAVQPTIISSGEQVQITVKITNGYQNLTKLLLSYGDGTSDEFFPPFAPPPPDDVLEMIHTYTSDGEFKPVAYLSGLNGLSAQCDCDCVVVTGEYKFWKQGVLSGSTVYRHIYGELPPTVTSFTVTDTLLGNSTLDVGSFDVQIGGKPYTLEFSNQDKTFVLTGDAPTDRDFDIYFTSKAHRGGNQEICNSADLSFKFQGKTIIEASDDYTHGKIDTPVCVSGYDLDIDKTILTSGQYVSEYAPEYNTYAPYAKEHGQVLTGNWYIYRVKVTNNGAGDAYDVKVDDTLPEGVTAFWMEPEARMSLFGGPVTFTPDIPLAKSFTWVIAFLGVNESKYIDIFVELGTGAKYAWGEEYCNVAYAQAEGEPESPISDDACMTVSGSCFRTCSGYVEIDTGTLTWKLQGNDLQVDATCIAKTTCGESTSFPADPAVLTYANVQLFLKKTDLQITNLPTWEWGGGTKTLTLAKSVQEQCGGDPFCESAYLETVIENYDAGNAFDNYKVNKVVVVGNDITIELATRTWKHWLTCTLKTACDTELYRTYEVTNYPALPTIPPVVPGESPKVVSTKHGSPVVGYPQTTNTHYYLSGCNLCDEGDGDDDECTTDADCTDNNVCNGAEACVGGECVPGTPLSCNDGLYCNGEEVCDPAMGCKPGSPVVCTDPDGTGCKTNACDESKDMCVIDSSLCGGDDGCKTDAECSDNNACNGAEACVAGDCKPGTPLTCDDGLYCNGVETCDPKNGCMPGTPVDCSDPDGPGCKTNACDESKDMCIIDVSTCQCQTNADCDDKNTCNGGEICVDNKCQNGTPLVCNDGLFCNGVETCDPIQGCTPGAPVVCTDPDGPGCKTNACDESKDMCVIDSSKCGTYCGDGKKQLPNDMGTGGKKNDGYEECDGNEGVGTGVICQGNCTCPAQSKYCPNQNICVPLTWPCIPLTKTINTGALYSGDQVIYTITYSNPTQYTWYNLEIRDYLPSSLTGNFVPKENTQIGQTFIWTGLTLKPGESKTITFSGTLICVGSGCVKPGDSMCNFVELRQGSGQIASAQACAKILACKIDAQCPNNETCDAGMCVKNSMCTSMSVIPPVGLAPLKTNYMCVGTGKQYTVTVADLSGKVITLLTGAQGMYTFAQSGNYTMTCSVDGDTGMKCYGKALTLKEVNMLIDTAILQLDAVTTGYVGQTAWSGAKLVIDPKDYLDLSQEAFIKKLSDAFYLYMSIHLPGIPYPPELDIAQQLIKQIVSTLVNAQCSESCRVPITVGSGIYKTCQAFTTDDPLYIAKNSGSIDVVCTPDPLFSGNLIEIHCNNSGNTILTGMAVDQGSGVYGLSGTCGYVGFGQYTPQCIIAGQTHPLCSLTLTLGNGGGGGSNGGGSNGGGGGSNGGGGGSNGGGGGGPLKPRLQEPVCAEIDPPALQVGEYLPFRWDLEATDDVDLRAQSCKDISGSKTIPGGSLYCNFALFNGSSLDDPIITLDHIPCMADKWKEDGVRLFNDVPGVKNMNYMGRWYTKIDQIDTKGIYGEYQIQLMSVDYERCSIDASGAKLSQGERAFGENDSRICAMNFAVSDGFMLQQGATLSTTNGDQLVNYRYLDGRAVIGLRELQLLSDKKLATYQAGDISYLTTTFVDRYVTRAVTTTTLPLLGGITVKKVSNADIYVYDGGNDRIPLRLRDIQASNVPPYTLIVRNADLIIEGTLKGKGMYIVPDGTIQFVTNNCDYQDTVEGMFIAPLGFRAEMIRNTNLFRSNWCSDGRLVVEGSLIGPIPENSHFVKAKRSVLDAWFDVTYQGQASKVFDAASVLLKANPKLWSTLPPGAGEFGAALTITK